MRRLMRKAMRLSALFLAAAVLVMLVPDTAYAAETSISSTSVQTDEAAEETEQTVTESTEAESADDAGTEVTDDAETDTADDAEADTADDEDEETGEQEADPETVTYSTSVTVDEDGTVIEEDSISDSAACEATSDASAATVTGTQTTYSLNISVSTTAASSTKKRLKNVTVSKAVLTTTVTNTYSDGSTSSSSSSATYELTLQCQIRNVGWTTAVTGASSYSCTASEALSGNYIQAVRIIPSDSLSAAMRSAGITFYYRATTAYFGTMGWAKAGSTAGSTGNANPMTGLELQVVTASQTQSLDTDDSYVAATKVWYKTRNTGASKWSSVRKNGATSGTKSASASIGTLAVKLVKSSSTNAYSGSVQYSVRTTIGDSAKNWSSYQSGFSAAGSKNAGIQAVKIQLTGEMAEKFDIYYRVYVGNYGWLGWAKNGEKAGTKGIGLTVGAIQIKLVPKGKSISGSTSDHYISSISGDSTLDSYLTAIYKKKGTNLKTLFNYVASYKYIRYYVWPTQSNWKSWSITYAKDMYKKQGGNCYRYASLFCWLARGLGYDAKVVVGYVPSRSQGWAPHGWVEIKQSGTTYIYDPDLKHDYWSLNWYKRTYSNAPLTYKKNSSSNYP